MRSDEWYTHHTNPTGRAGVHVLLALDEEASNLDPAHRMGDHPLAWHHGQAGGRAFTSVLGHTSESYTEPAFVAHLAAAIEWAASSP